MKVLRSLRWLSPLLLCASSLIGGIGASTQFAAAATLPACNAQHFIGSSSVSTRPGGTTVRLVLTSKYFPTCTWSNLTIFQFVTANDRYIGAPISYVSQAPTETLPATPWKVNDTFQVVQYLTTEEGVRCAQATAAYVSVAGPSSAALRIKLPQTVGVCTGATTQWTSLQALSFPQPSRCNASALKISVGRSNGTAGTIFYPIVFTNVSSKNCTVSGIPSVQPTTGASPGVAHILVGPQSARTTIAGYGDSIRLAPKASASTSLGVTETLNFPVSACRAEPFASLSVGLAGVGSYWVALSSTTCTKRISTGVRGLVPNATGLAP